MNILKLIKDILTSPVKFKRVMQVIVLLCVTAIIIFIAGFYLDGINIIFGGE